MTSRLVQNRQAEEEKTARRKKRKRIILIASALIVAITFFVKEVLRDQAKFYIDRIERASSAVEKQEGTTTTDEFVMLTNKRMSELNMKLENIKLNQHVTAGQIADGATGMTADFVDATAMFELLSALQDALYKSGGDELRQQRDKVRSDLEQVRLRDKSIVTTDTGIPNPTARELADVINGQIDVLNFEVRAAEWQKAVYAEATRKRDGAAIFYQACTQLWYVLAAIAGILSLIVLVKYDL